MPEPTLEEIRALYAGMKRIAVVGCSSDPTKAGNYIPRYLRAYGYEIFPVNPRQTELLGTRCYASLAEIEVPIDVVEVFRPAEEAPDIAREAVAIGARCVWMQLGVQSDEAARIARDGGLMAVNDRCMGVVHGQLGLGPGVHLGDEWHRGVDPIVPRASHEQPYLQITSGPAEGRAIPTDVVPMIIGREGERAGRIAGDQELSRRHARLSRTDQEQVRIEDLGSSNGTYVNGVRTEDQVLVIGDTVQLGATALELRTPEARERRSAVHDRAQLNALAAERAVASGSPSDPMAFRAEFPVFERVTYLNAGSDGPVPRRALEAASAHMQLVLEEGRSGDAYQRRLRTSHAALRAGYARILGCQPDEVALTGGTHDGINTILWGLHLRRRDEILTSDEEHVSVLAPLAAVAKRIGVDIRVVPFDALPGEVGPRTRLVVCSHVSWRTGRIADVPQIVASGAPVLIDGAQAVGAVPLDVHALGCDYYATSGQKWLCGPHGTGCLYVRSNRLRTLSPPWPSGSSLGAVGEPGDLIYHAGAQRFDTAKASGPLATWALAALEVLEDAGLEWVTRRGPMLAGLLAARLAERGVSVARRGPTTLVTWTDAMGAGLVTRLGDAGIVVRAIGPDRIRASVGAWNTEDELEILVQLVG
jgi:L-cysteine/cystine lyase